MSVLGQELDTKARDWLIHRCGPECHRRAYGPPDPNAPILDEFIARRQEKFGPEHTRREGDTVYFDYVQNPRGLKVSQGYCLSPIVEDGPADLLPTLCECSVGYVKELLGRVARQPVEVELLESVRRGGKGCRFRARLLG